MANHEHDCIHEADLVEMKVTLQHIVQLAQDTNKTLKGNGSPGLCTEMALMKQKQGWVWIGLGGVASTVLGLAGYILRGLVG